MRVLFPMRQALSDAQLLAGALPGPSWAAWRSVLIAAAGEALNDDERQAFERLTGRAKEPGCMCEALLAVAGRRSGKSKIAAVFMVWLATCVDWTDDLSIGETGVALIVAPTERQAAVTVDYIKAIISSTPLLSALIEDETQQRFRLKRHVAIEVLAANAKWVRGFTAIGVALDECAYLPSNEDAANSDISILEAVRPTLATTGGPLILTSSPATTTGIVHRLFEKHYGADGNPEFIVVQSDTRGLNPTIRQSVIDKAFADDAVSAGAEYGGQFREPMTGYISRETLERCVERGAPARMPLPAVQYSCFVDAASGSGTDSFAVCIGHTARDADRDVIIVDAVIGNKPPFNPLEVIAGFVGVLQRWNISEVTGDDYAGNFLRSAFAKHRVNYKRSTLTTSELYLAALPAFTSGTVVLPDVPGLVTEFVNLRRKVGTAGRETVTHMRGYHDDAANAVCGLIHLLTPIAAVEVNWDAVAPHIGVFTQPRVIAGVTDAAHASEAPHAPSRSLYKVRRGGGNGGSVVW